MLQTVLTKVPKELTEKRRDSMTIFYWLILFVTLVILEACTMQLVALWFAGGSLVGMLVLLLGGSTELQLIAFLIVSFVLFILVKPVADTKFKGHLTKTNVESLEGKQARVTRQISGNETSGAAIVNGLEWTAIAADGSSVYEEGTYVIIKEIRGVKLVVEAAPARIQEQ